MTKIKWNKEYIAQAVFRCDFNSVFFFCRRNVCAHLLMHVLTEKNVSPPDTLFISLSLLLIAYIFESISLFSWNGRKKEVQQLWQCAQEYLLELQYFSNSIYPTCKSRRRHRLKCLRLIRQPIFIQPQQHMSALFHYIYIWLRCNMHLCNQFHMLALKLFTLEASRACVHCYSRLTTFVTIEFCDRYSLMFSRMNCIRFLIHI